MSNTKKRLQTDDVEPAGRSDKKRLQPLSLDNSMYAGRTEVDSYITLTEKPRFIHFVNDNQENLVDWSARESSFSEEQLLALWKQRFALALRLAGKEISKDTLKTNKSDNAVWTTILQKMAAKELDEEDSEDDGQDLGEESVAARYFHEAHRLAYIKLNGGAMTDEELASLNELMVDTPTSTISSLVTLGVSYLKKRSINPEELMMAVLSISGIINLLDIKMIDIYKNSFSEAQWQHVLDEERSMNINDYSGLNNESEDILNRLLALRNADDILEFIDEQKYALSKSKQSRQQPYIMLLIVEQIVRNFARWSSSKDESELTIYRRFAALLDILLDSTNIEMIDGENTSEATKVSIDMNRSIFGLGEQSSSYGRRIDLMFGISHGKKRVEISSNEWKRNVVSKEVVQKQQCKNLRTNACIIQQIMTRYKINTPVMAMDFVGNCGCLYIMKKTQEQVFIAKPVARLATPYHVDHLGALRPTLSALFQMKSFLIEQTRNINASMFELDVDNTLPSLNLPSLSNASASAAPSSYIFWETKCKNNIV